MARNDRRLAILAFRLGERVDVLLVPTDDAAGWSLPSGTLQKGMTQHASAALEARREAGVSGRIYKRPLRPTRETDRTIIFPMLVMDEARRDARDNPPRSQWFPLRDALGLIDQTLRPALDDFTRRIGRG